MSVSIVDAFAPTGWDEQGFPRSETEIPAN